MYDLLSAPSFYISTFEKGLVWISLTWGEIDTYVGGVTAERYHVERGSSR